MPIRPRSGRCRVVRREKIMLQLVGGGLFEAEHFAALRIKPGHDVADGTVLAARIHSLKNQQQSIAVGGVMQILQRARSRDVLGQELFITLLCLAIGAPWSAIW